MTDDGNNNNTTLLACICIDCVSYGPGYENCIDCVPYGPGYDNTIGCVVCLLRTSVILPPSATSCRIWIKRDDKEVGHQVSYGSNATIKKQVSGAVPDRAAIKNSVTMKRHTVRNKCRTNRATIKNPVVPEKPEVP
jgi:hypothetical protein